MASYASVFDQAGAASVVATALETFGRLDIVIKQSRYFRARALRSAYG